MFWTKNNPSISDPAIDALKPNFTDQELTELAQLATPVEVEAGTQLTVEGDLGRQAVIIVKGTATVRRNEAFIAQVGPGDMVGEIALLSGEPRTATVVADTDATVYALSANEFASLMHRCPALERRLAANAVRRVTAAA